MTAPTEESAGGSEPGGWRGVLLSSVWRLGVLRTGEEVVLEERMD